MTRTSDDPLDFLDPALLDNTQSDSADRALESLMGGGQALDLAMANLFPSVKALAPLSERQQLRADLVALSKRGAPVPGLGGHGEIYIAEEWVDIHQLVPNPEHPRSDWQVQDDHHALLARHLNSGGFGQMDPIICTPLEPGDELYSDSPLHNLLMIDGYRVYWAAFVTKPNQRVRVKVITNTETGQPLSRLDCLTWWLTRTLSRKPTQLTDIALALVRIRYHVELMDPSVLLPQTPDEVELLEEAEQAQDHQSRVPPPAFSLLAFTGQTNRQLAENLCTTPATLSYADSIARQPARIRDALVHGTLLPTHVLTLIKYVPDEQERIRAAVEISALNLQRLRDDRPMMSGTLIRHWLEEQRIGIASVLRLANPKPQTIHQLRQALRLPDTQLDQAGRIIHGSTVVSRVLADDKRRKSSDPMLLLAADLADAISILDTLISNGTIRPSSQVANLIQSLGAPGVVADVFQRLQSAGVVERNERTEEGDWEAEEFPTVVDSVDEG